MATSGTTAFTLDLSDIFEEAFERAGSELRSGYDYRTARRSLDLLMLEWQNRGLNLWTVRDATHSDRRHLVIRPDLGKARHHRRGCCELTQATPLSSLT